MTKTVTSVTYISNLSPTYLVANISIVLENDSILDLVKWIKNNSGSNPRMDRNEFLRVEIFSKRFSLLLKYDSVVCLDDLGVSCYVG